MEQFLNDMLVATQGALREADIICGTAGMKMNDEFHNLIAGQQKLVIDISIALAKMRSCRPVINPLYFAAICSLSNDETISNFERSNIVATAMKLYGLLTNKNHEMAWHDIVKVADEENITINAEIKTIIDKTIAKVGGYPTFTEFL